MVENTAAAKPAGAAERPSTSRRWSVISCGAVLILAALAAYHNSFTGSFIFDDVPSIQENPTIRHLWPISNVLSPPHEGWITVEGRPVVNFSLAVNYALGGYNVWGYHALNLAIHILAGLTLFGIVRRTLLQPALRGRFGAVANELALAVALIWTVHPLQTESVTYVIQRAESIMGLFYLLTLYCFIRGAASSPRPRLWHGLCVGACALGMASKEVMVSAPLIVMLYDRTFVSGSFQEAWRRRRPLYLGLLATWILQTFMVFSEGTFSKASAVAQRAWGGTWWEYLLIEPGVILHYLRLAAWPSPLCFDYYGWPVSGTGRSILLPTLVIAILLGATAWTCKTNYAWGFLGACFFLILAPSSSIIPLDSPAYEHRMYLPLAAVVTGAVVVAFVLGKQLLSNQSGLVLGWVACGFVVVPLAVLTVQRNRDYISELAIWQDTVAKCPNNPRAHNWLGLGLMEMGKVQEAIGQYEQALRLKPDFAEAHTNLGNALAKAGRLDDAIRQCEEAVRLKPNYAGARVNLGAVLEKLGKFEDAIRQYEEALRIDPDFAMADKNLAGALMRTGKIKEAIRRYEQTLQLAPDSAETHRDLGVALQQAGRTADAVEQYQQAARLKPDDDGVLNDWGISLEHWARTKSGAEADALFKQAAEKYGQALRINPDSAEVLNNWGTALWEQAKTKGGAEAEALFKQALEKYEQAVRIRPDYARTHYNLATVLLAIGNVQEAVKHLERVVQLNPGSAEAHNRLADGLEQTGRTREAIKHYEEALRIKPDFADAYNNLAWLLATRAQAEGADAVRAVALAKQATELSDNRVATYLDTLAAAYAAAGRYGDAIATAQDAVELARSGGQPHLAAKIEGRLQLYRDGHAYRQPAGGTQELRDR